MLKCHPASRFWTQAVTHAHAMLSGRSVEIDDGQRSDVRQNAACWAAVAVRCAVSKLQMQVLDRKAKADRASACTSSVNMCTYYY